MYKTRDTKIQYFICSIDDMVDYLGKLPPFGAGHRLLEENILKLVDFSLPKEWKKELITQGLESATQGLTELVKFCEHLETAEETFQMQGEKTKQSGELHQYAKSAQSKRWNQAAKPPEEDAKKIKPKRKTHLCALWMALVTTWTHAR